MNKRVLAELEAEEAKEKAEKEAAEKERLEKLADAYMAAKERAEAPPPPPAVPPTVIQFSPEMFAAAIGTAFAQQIPAIAELLKQQKVDPEVERIKLLRKQQMRETQKEAKKADVDKWLSCSHMRTHPYSGTARIGWAQQSDGYTRGTCMGCGCPFTPIESELPDPERMRGLYEKMRAVPVSIAHNDFAAGMVVAGQPA